MSEPPFEELPCSAQIAVLRGMLREAIRKDDYIEAAYVAALLSVVGKRVEELERRSRG